VVLARWFDKWRLAFPTHEVSQKQLLVYAEALDDLTPEMIDAGCREAGRTAEQFPKPGHIRRALEANYADTETICFGPPAEKYPEPTAEEKAEHLKWREHYAKLEKEALAQRAKPPGKKRYNPPPPRMSLEDQKKILREKGFLN
jgi:hypothetical protein